MARRRERDPLREETPGTLPRDPFGRREGRASARLDFLFDARRMDPASGAPRSRTGHAPFALRREEPPEAPALGDPPIPPAEEPPADPLPVSADATPPPFDPPPAAAELPALVSERPPDPVEEAEPAAVPERPAPAAPPALAAPAPPPSPRPGSRALPPPLEPRGFKRPGACHGAAAFVPGTLVAAAQVAACVALGLIARLFSRREA